MKNILLFEQYSPNIDIKNDLTNHLSQFPYISYTLKDADKNVIITFNKDVNAKYGLGLLEPFNKEVVTKTPLSVKVINMKNIDKFQEFNGKTILQNIEKVDFPELKIFNLESKLDTGASCSSIYASKIKINRETKKVSFVLLDDSYEQYTGNMISVPIHSEIRVQSSNGDESSRPLIQTDIVIKGKTYEIFISLSTERKKLEYAVLLGKDILSNFLIQAGI